MSALDDLCKTPFHEADNAARAAVLRRLADTELFVALAEEPEGETISLLRLPLGDGAEAALACDDEARLAAALGRPVPYAVLPGRELARRLAAAGVGLLVNPDAPSAMLLDAGTLDWLTGALAGAPAAEEAWLGPLRAPDAAVVAALAEPLGARLADMPGLVEEAVLVGAEGAHLLILKGTPEAARPALAKAVAELVAFLPPLPAPLDVTFDAPAALPAGALAIRLEPLPPPQPAPPEPPRPPRLR
ncbi:hypothetical protein GI374_16555 [Paracoccus sp. S-4012]|uniref:SseB family protein n=1 Tax=Paracoccus sp. S-4012 TaxID=2665648 RepID=UPI0013258543|nr:hypothetical protein [Paracoccus sp. S-4012]